MIDVSGKRTGKRKDEWREKTILAREGLLGSIFGYWLRPRKLSAEHVGQFQARKVDYTPEAGLGIPRDLLHPVLFALPDLMSVFCHWRARRSGGESPALVNLLHIASEFVRPETGPVWQDEEMLEHLERFKVWWDANPHATPEGPVVLDITAFQKGWRAAVEASFRVLREDLHRVLKGKLPKSRDPFLTVDVFVEHKRPLELYMRGVRSMLASEPTSILSQHVHNRRKVQTMILVQTGLRTGTMLMTIGGRNPELRKVEGDDGVITWEIEIQPERFKNFDSPYFSEGRPYRTTLEDEDGLYALLDEYIGYSRTYLLRGRKSDALFVNKDGGDMDENRMRAEYHIITRQFFVRNELTGTGAVKGAVVHGMHVVRHVIATHIVKVTGDIRLAAHAIQDTPRTAERHYARFWPDDKLSLVAGILKRARAAGRLAA